MIRGNFQVGVASVELWKALRIVDDWAKRWRLTFNPKKYSAIWFSGPWVCIAQEFRVGLQAGPILTIGAIWYLVVWFYANLLLDRHIQKAVAGAIDVPFATKPSSGMAQQRLFLILKVVLHVVVIILKVLHFSIKSRCSRCYIAHF